MMRILMVKLLAPDEGAETKVEKSGPVPQPKGLRARRKMTDALQVNDDDDDGDDDDDDYDDDDDDDPMMNYCWIIVGYCWYGLL